MRVQEYFTPLELAEMAQRLDVRSIPRDRSDVQKYISKHGLDGSTLAQTRRGRGGGVEYHFSLFPEEFVVAFIDHRRREVAEAEAREALTKQQEVLALLGEAQLTAKQQRVMEARAAIVDAVKAYRLSHGCKQGPAVDAVLAMIETDKQLKVMAQTANDRAGKGRITSRAAIYRWLKTHKEKGVAALAPKVTKDTASFPEWFPYFMNFYARPQSPTITVALNEYINQAQPDEPPSYHAVRRCLKKLDKREGTQARFKGREGALALKARHAYVVRDTSGLSPTSVYTSDGKLFDAEVQHPIHGRPFRPEITPILDVATRKCVGWSVGLVENSRDVMAALRDATINHGVAAIFYVDRGPGFRNDALDNALTGFCARLGTTKMHSLPYNSQARGVMERFHSTVFTPLSKTYSSYIGADMDREAKQLAHKKSRKEIKEFGASSSMPTWIEFIRDIEAAINTYNDTPHDGLKARDASGRRYVQTPNQAWQAALINGFEPVTVHPHEADQLFRPTVRRRTNRAMVSFIGNSYFHLGLEPFHGTDILVGYDVRDAHKVWCYEIDTVDGEEIAGKLICVADFEGNKERYVPFSMEQKAIEDRQKGRERRLEVHLQEVRDEANGQRFLSQEANIPFSVVSGDGPIIDMAAEREALSSGLRSAAPDNTKPNLTLVIDEDADNAKTREVKPTPMRGGRPIFHEDHEFAAWCVRNPECVTEKDRSHLISISKTKGERDYLRVNGVNLEALRTLLQNGADMTPTERKDNNET